MQAITISIDSRFNLQLQCPIHPLQGVISYCIDEACNLPLCISCIAAHCQTHFIKGSQPKLEDAGRLYAQFSEALQNILKQTEHLQKTISSYENYSQQERTFFEEMERCKQSIHNLIDMTFDKKTKNIQEEFFSFSAKVNSLESDARLYYTQITSREGGANMIQELLQQNKIQRLLEELKSLDQKTRDEKDLLKSYKVIVEHDSIKQRVLETLNAFIQIYEEKNIFEAMNASIQKLQELPIQNEIPRDIEKKLEDIKNQLMSNLGELKPKKIHCENTEREEKSQMGSVKSSRKPSVLKKGFTGHQNSSKIRSPFAELQNIEANKEDLIEVAHSKVLVVEDSSRENAHESGFINQYANKMLEGMEEGYPISVSSATPNKHIIILKSTGAKSVLEIEASNSTHRIEMARLNPTLEVETSNPKQTEQEDNQKLNASGTTSNFTAILDPAGTITFSKTEEIQSQQIEPKEKPGPIISFLTSKFPILLDTAGFKSIPQLEATESQQIGLKFPIIMASDTPDSFPAILDSAGFKSIPKLDSKKMDQEYPMGLDTNEGTLDLPNENSFFGLRNRTSFDSLSQETCWGSDSKNSETRDFFTIEQFVSDRESETLSRCGSVTKDFDNLERRQLIERIESDFSIKASNDSESEKIGFVYYLQWRSKLLHLMHLDQVDKGVQHPRFETHKLNIDFMIPDYHGSILLPNKKIYIIGGQSLTQQGLKHKETYQLNLEDLQMSRCADLLSARDSHSLTYCDGFIYALGGIISDGNGDKAFPKIVTERCERYDVQKDCWSEIKPMEYPVCNQCSCVFNKKYIFTFGGRTSSTKLINKIFRYTIATDSWLTLHMKPADRIGSFILNSQACCRQINSKHIFVFGGYSEERNISNQSFVLEVDEDSREKGKRGFEIKYINKKRLIFAAPFWEKQPIIHNNKLYCLQNIITHSNPKLSYCVSRRVLCFDGKKWSSLC